MAADVKIDIAAEFTGKKAFRQAETATEKMSKNVKKLAGALGLAFGGQAILAYGKKAVKAAAEDEKAQKQLALALKNVGLGRDAASSEAYIQRLQSEFGILDDKLRPAYQTLAVATGNTAEAQRLLNLSLDIAASTGKDLGSVTSALSRAYLGNNAALSKLGVGISKADLKAGKFEDIIAQLEGTFKGAATQSANTFQGSIDKLGVAAANASEIIGTGLIDALKGLGDQDSVDNLATSMQNVATYTADVIRGIGVMIEKLKGLPGIGALDIQMIPIIGAYISALNAAGKASKGGYGITAQGLAHLAELQARYAAATLATKRKLTAEELKALKAAKLKAAIDKANLALGKGNEIFDMEKIQVAAALTNQAEQLGKATTSTQALQIANDTARLNVKQSIFALEEAIASKDEQAITAATNKLNADLKVLGALSGQSVKLSDIKSILESLKPADLINLSNLDAAIAKMMELIRLQGIKPSVSGGAIGGAGAINGGGAIAGAMTKEDEHLSKLAAQAVSAIVKPTYTNTPFDNGLFNLEDVARSSLIAGLAGGAGVSGAVSGSRYAAQAANQYNITIQANTVANPDELTNLIQNSLIQLNRRGDSLVQAGTL
jgi:hypothetical protein